MRPQRHRPPIRVLATIASVLILFVSACGGGSDSDGFDLIGAGGDDSAPGGDTGDGGSDDEPAASPEDVDRTTELVGRWEITDYALNEGSITNVLGENVHIDFAEDGTANYHTGCNQGGTTWATSGLYHPSEGSVFETRPEGQSISIGPSFEQTEIGCEGFLGEQDVDLPARLSETTIFILDGDRLLLRDESLKVQAVRAS